MEGSQLVARVKRHVQANMQTLTAASHWSHRLQMAAEVNRTLVGELNNAEIAQLSTNQSRHLDAALATLKEDAESLSAVAKQIEETAREMRKAVSRTATATSALISALEQESLYKWRHRGKGSRDA